MWWIIHEKQHEIYGMSHRSILNSERGLRCCFICRWLQLIQLVNYNSRDPESLVEHRTLIRTPQCSSVLDSTLSDGIISIITVPLTVVLLHIGMCNSNFPLSHYLVIDYFPITTWQGVFYILLNTLRSTSSQMKRMYISFPEELSPV